MIDSFTSRAFCGELCYIYMVELHKANQTVVEEINANTENQVACTKAVRGALNQDTKMIDPRKYLSSARKTMVKVVKSKIQSFGSNNQA